jgi:hypothetical protein
MMHQGNSDESSSGLIELIPHKPSSSQSERQTTFALLSLFDISPDDPLTCSSFDAKD